MKDKILRMNLDFIRNGSAYFMNLFSSFLFQIFNKLQEKIQKYKCTYDYSHDNEISGKKNKFWHHISCIGNLRSHLRII